MNAAELGMSLGLRALNRVAGLELLDRIGMRNRAEALLYSATKNGFRAAEGAGRTFNGPGPKLSAPARQARGERAAAFDLSPTDEQQMMREAIGDFAQAKLRPAALAANDACAAPIELLRQANELGVAMLGVPGELDGAFEERSAVTSVLVAEQLARGDLGRRYAAASGDRNPIHLYGLTAKAFGFPRQIAHGMWTKARCLAQLESRLPNSFTVEVAFKRPILLPGKVEFASEAGDGGAIAFGVRARDGASHLAGFTAL